MKQIINIQEQYGAELHTRQMMERLAASLVPTNEYLLDMAGVEQISRSAADELYNLTHSEIHVDLINLEPFVEKMLSAVTKGRFLPRQHTAGDMPIIHCATIGSVQRQLMAKYEIVPLRAVLPSTPEKEKDKYRNKEI
jgi:hypothetical protein